MRRDTARWGPILSDQPDPTIYSCSCLFHSFTSPRSGECCGIGAVVDGWMDGGVDCCTNDVLCTGLQTPTAHTLSPIIHNYPHKLPVLWGNIYQPHQPQILTRISTSCFSDISSGLNLFTSPAAADDAKCPVSVKSEAEAMTKHAAPPISFRVRVYTLDFARFSPRRA